MRKALALLALSGCLAVAGTAGATSQASDSSSYWYPSDFKKSYMRACSQDGDVAYCGCTLQWMTSHVSFDRFMRSSDKQLNRWVTRAVDACYEQSVWY